MKYFDSRREWALWFISLPWTLTVGWGFPLLMMCIGAVSPKSLHMRKRLVLAGVWKEWAAEIWKFSTTLGHGMVFQERALLNTRIPRHEDIHVRQHDDDMMRSFLAACLIFAVHGVDFWWVALIIWWSGGLWVAPNFLTAWLRGGRPYRDSEHERAAYGQTDIMPRVHRSWEDYNPFGG